MVGEIVDKVHDLISGLAPKEGHGRVDLYLVGAHQPSRDPRILWEAENSKADLSILLGIAQGFSADKIHVNKLRDDIIELVIPHERVSKSWVKSSDIEAPLPIRLLARQLEDIAQSAPETLIDQFEISLMDANVLRSTAMHFLISYVALSKVARELAPLSNIIAADLDSLLPALTIRDIADQLVYDAHEFFPEANTYPLAVVNFWKAFEGATALHADARFVASDPSAAEMSDLYGYAFKGLNNSEPLSSLITEAALTEKLSARSKDVVVRFVFMGGISPIRGIRQTVEAWSLTPENCHLFIQGPNGEAEYYKGLQTAAGSLLGKRVFFVDPVSESEMIPSLLDKDVGLIPYEPITANNINCCPNKLSQYIASGLPIICNALPLVKDTIEAGDCGFSCDFENPEDVAAIVSRLADNADLRRLMSWNARTHFKEHFNWERQSGVFNETLGTAAICELPDRDQLGTLDLESLNLDLTPQALLRHELDIIGARSVWPLFSSNESISYWDSSASSVANRSLSWNAQDNSVHINLPANIPVLGIFINISSSEPIEILEICSIGPGGSTGFIESQARFDQGALVRWTGSVANEIVIRTQSQSVIDNTMLTRISVYSHAEGLSQITPV